MGVAMLTWLRRWVGAPETRPSRATKGREACIVTRYRYASGEKVERHSVCGLGLRNGDNPVMAGWTSRTETTHWVE